MHNALCARDWERLRCWGGQQASQSAPMQSPHSESGGDLADKPKSSVTSDGGGSGGSPSDVYIPFDSIRRK